MPFSTKTVEPCAVCKTLGGKTNPGYDRPIRFSGAQFGIPGRLCAQCYWRAKRKGVPVDAGLTVVVIPCARCGTTGGSTQAPSTYPERFNGNPLGVEGYLCRECWEDLRDAERDEVMFASGEVRRIHIRRCLVRFNSVMRRRMDAARIG